jgi:hypothetical protein
VEEIEAEFWRIVETPDNVTPLPLPPPFKVVGLYTSLDIPDVLPLI